MSTESIDSAATWKDATRDRVISDTESDAKKAQISGGHLLILGALLAVSLVAISSRSLWIDEACTAMKTLPSTLGGWWQLMLHDKTADVQMPLYMLYIWGWAQAFGNSEWSLHLANVPWFVLGAMVFVLSFPAGQWSRRFALLLILLCPFAWYYLDEARPYAMQLGSGLLIVGSLRHLLRAQSATPPADTLPLCGFLLGVVVLSGSSLLGMIWSAAALAAALLLLSLPQIGALWKRHWNVLLITTGPLLVLALYYLWTLKSGARASAAATTTIGSIFFAIYELLGFTGLGPGRLQMRDAGPAALRGHLSGVGIYGLMLVLAVGAALLAAAKSQNRKQLALIVCCSLPPIFIFAVGIVAHFRVLGRHLTPFVPVWLLLLVLGLTALWSRKSFFSRAVVVVFCIVSLLSCLSLRFAPRHEKDDYRAAAAMAKAALEKGSPIWWNAAEEGAHYYGVPLKEHPDAAAAIFLMNPTRQALEALPEPQLIAASKRDVYDSQDAVAAYIRERGFKPAAEFTAFVIWEKSVK